MKVIVLCLWAMCCSVTSYAQVHDITIEGAALAGLTAGYRALKLGQDFVIYEASHSPGGRIQTSTFTLTLKSGQKIQVPVFQGAELISSDDHSFLDLADEIGVQVFKKPKVPQKYFLNGIKYSEAQLMDLLFNQDKSALQELARQIKLLGPFVNSTETSARNKLPKSAKALDIHADQYLARIGASPLLTNYFRAGIFSEWGRDVSDITALSFFDDFTVEMDKKLVTFLPYNDESIVVLGGTGRMIEKLTDILKDHIVYDHTLEEINENSDHSIRLVFKTSKGQKIVRTQETILALPPQALQKVRWNKGVRPAILDADLQFAANTKITLFFERKVWDDSRHYGITSDGFPFQIWETILSPDSPVKALTVYTGPTSNNPARAKKGIEDVLKYLASEYEGVDDSFLNWVRVESLQSYAGPDRPGDRTKHRGLGRPSNRIQFAGDTVAPHNQGYATAAVASGEIAIRRSIRNLVRRELRSARAEGRLSEITRLCDPRLKGRSP